MRHQPDTKTIRLLVLAIHECYRLYDAQFDSRYKNGGRPRRSAAGATYWNRYRQLKAHMPDDFTIREIYRFTHVAPGPRRHRRYGNSLAANIIE